MTEKKPVFNAAGTHVYLYNAETGGLWECGPEAAEVFVDKLGWEYAEAPEEDLSDLFQDVALAADASGLLASRAKKAAKKAPSKTSGD